MSFPAKDFLAGIIATWPLRGIAFDGLGINDGQGRAGLAALSLARDPS